MSTSAGELLRIDRTLLAETQDRVNKIFADDLLHPVYIISENEEEGDCLMSVCGGPASLVYRDKITDWQGGGYLVWAHKDRMAEPLFQASILHEIAHCFQPGMEAPWSCWPEDIGLAANYRGNVQFARSTNYHRYHWHKADFWRIAVHVRHRAALVGYESSFADFGRTWVSPDDLQNALEQEIKELEDMPLWKIGRRPVPRYFERLFDFDVNDWDNVDSFSHLFENTDKGGT